MLVLNRKINQRIVVGDQVLITVLSIRGNYVSLGIEAPPGVPVFREEVLCRVEHQPKSLAKTVGTGGMPPERCLMEWVLVVDQGMQKGKIIPISLSPFVIGWDKDCQLRSDTPSISQRHCALLIQGERIILRDLQSINGTFVNAQKVKSEVELHLGDRITMGPLAFVVGREGDEAKKRTELDPATEDPTVPADEDAIAPTFLGMEEVDSRRHLEKVTLTEQIGQRLLGQTPSLAALAEPLVWAASHDMPLLLSGETGTGKTYLARLIHDCSRRGRHKLLVIPCGALIGNLVESELFGHVRGAFTGADQDKVGGLEAAGNGTILMDEIETLGLEQQSNLLRVIETGEYEPVGSNRTQVCTARIIAATNCNLEEAVERGRFRQDLYYRLNVMTIYLPPLRQRVQDIAPLAQSMAVRLAQRFGKELFGISRPAMAALEAFPWPGNVRQLENVLQQAVLTSHGAELLWPHLPRLVKEHAELGTVAWNSRLAADGFVLDREPAGGV